LNITPVAGTLISRKLATLLELQTLYSYEDALTLIEVVQVDDYNKWVVDDYYRKKAKRTGL
jgi:hypothetical protein